MIGGVFVVLLDTPYVNTHHNGSVLVRSKLNDNNSINYMAMLMMLLVTSNLKLDMYINKKTPSAEEFDFSFGHFPLKSDYSNYLGSEVTTWIGNAIKHYNPEFDYVKELSEGNPNVGKLFSIITSEINKPGTMKIGLDNKIDRCEIGLSVNSNYDYLAKSFSSSGAVVTNDLKDNKVIRVSGTPKEQYDILAATEANLLNNHIDLWNSQLEEFNAGYAKVGRVNTVFLMVVAVAEVLLLGFYFLFLF